MVKVMVNIFDYEDKLVSETKEKYGFASKNDALNFIIRKFEKHLKETEEDNIQPLTEITPSELQETAKLKEKLEIFEEKPSKKKVKRPKKLSEEKPKQSVKRLKDVISEE